MYIKNGGFKKYKHIISYMPVIIYDQPISGLKSVGSDYTFSVFVRGSDPISYQWYKDNLPILNETTNKISLTGLQLTDTGNYRCSVGNNSYTISTNTATLSVMNPPTFVTQVSSITATLDSNVIFSVSAVDSYPLTYKWYKNNVLIPNATGENYHIYPISTSNTGTYYATASNLVATVTSDFATLTIN